MTATSDAPFAALLGVADVDRTSPVPLYCQVAQAIETAITSGTLPPGTRLENELVLAERLGLSRPTMRRAMQDLVDKGLIVRRRGLGTRVVQPKVRRSLELTSLYDDLLRDGQQPTTQVLSLAVEPAQDEVAAALFVTPGAAVLRIERLRSASGGPLALMTNYVPDGLIDPTIRQLETEGLYGLFRAAGVTMHSASQTVGARNATTREANVLAERKGAALLTMKRIAYDDHGTAVEYGSHVYAASRYAFDFNLLST